MTKTDQKVEYKINNANHGRFLGQTITDISTDDENYALGIWHGKAVASFHIENSTWHVIF